MNFMISRAAPPSKHVPAQMAMIELSIYGCTSKAADINEGKRRYRCTDMCKCNNCVSTGDDEGCYE